jgi:hypothetical protein
LDALATDLSGVRVCFRHAASVVVVAF